ncbi:uncharacterized protein PFL1_04563 [Pseudozyma flocculosa PF-1]|uniref:Uncharacterized protein n=1 Tax=Pseudozyma flocculosa PF-1 TaxID=1277687 RepID=A0A061H598_9BASI|nr:uncharacterized protein PFL1_04563 [Pseudozyma flocculosa PF-1]EPQ27818.1 hypothetical protein PFL1_04563 [Pseudozyma flocculosa PF-1]
MQSKSFSSKGYNFHRHAKRCDVVVYVVDADWRQIVCVVWEAGGELSDLTLAAREEADGADTVASREERARAAAANAAVAGPSLQQEISSFTAAAKPYIKAVEARRLKMGRPAFHTLTLGVASNDAAHIRNRSGDLAPYFTAGYHHNRAASDRFLASPAFEQLRRQVCRWTFACFPKAAEALALIGLGKHVVARDQSALTASDDRSDAGSDSSDLTELSDLSDVGDSSEPIRPGVAQADSAKPLSTFDPFARCKDRGPFFGYPYTRLTINLPSRHTNLARHKDSRDYKNGVSCVAPFGADLDLVVGPNVRIKARQGDLILFAARHLVHGNTGELTEERGSLVFHSHHSVARHSKAPVDDDRDAVFPYLEEALRTAITQSDEVGPCTGPSSSRQGPSRTKHGQPAKGSSTSVSLSKKAERQLSRKKRKRDEKWAKKQAPKLDEAAQADP